MLYEVTCGECGTNNLVRWHAATEIDPGYYDRDDCEGCGEALEMEDAEPYDPDEEEADRMYDLMNDR